MRRISKDNINRIIDANINRAKEGLRVCEDIARFILENRDLTAHFKETRHKIDNLVERLTDNIRLLKERRSLKDVGLNIYINELRRKNFQDIFFANIQRVKESIRVLEEFMKLKGTKFSIEFKKIRYFIYELEKKAARKLLLLRHHR